MYATLAQTKVEVKTDRTSDDNQVLLYIKQVSHRIDNIMNSRYARPYFQPWLETREFPLTPDKINSWRNTYYLDTPILSLTSASAGGTDIASVVELVPQYSAITSAIRFSTYGRSWYDYCGGSTPYPVTLSVTGLWGYRPHYSEAWVTYDQITTTAVTPAATTFTVNDVDGADPWGITPRFSPGQLIRFGASATEMNEVTATDTVTNTVTVRRTTNGSTAASGNAAIGENVQVFQVEEPIQRITARQAGLLYARKGAYQVVEIDGIGTTVYPQDLLRELVGVLNDYRQM